MARCPGQRDEPPCNRERFLNGQRRARARQGGAPPASPLAPGHHSRDPDQAMTAGKSHLTPFPLGSSERARYRCRSTGKASSVSALPRRTYCAGGCPPCSTLVNRTPTGSRGVRLERDPRSHQPTISRPREHTRRRLPRTASPAPGLLVPCIDFTDVRLARGMMAMSDAVADAVALWPAPASDHLPI
jgi:hypothetical protein